MSNSENSPHITVLKNELVDHLNLKKDSTVIDCTAGYGGHLSRILQDLEIPGRALAIDRDENSIKFLQNAFIDEISCGLLTLVHEPFSKLLQIAKERKLMGKVDAICADIGVSSPQLDIPSRGFSMMKNGPLDMRMDTRQSLTAKEIVNTYSQSELIYILKTFGEEPKAKYIANAILASRNTQPIESTAELSEIVASNIFYKNSSKKHPATKTFQALRIAVNNELGELETLCENAFEILRPGGRLGIISFHSLEDRIVKNKFKMLAEGKRNDPSLRGLPISHDEFTKLSEIKAKLIKPFPIKPSDTEIAANPRARSAKLRVIEKI